MKFLRGLNQAANYDSEHHFDRLLDRQNATVLHIRHGRAILQAKPFLDSVDDELAVYMPSPLEEKRLRGALDDLKDFESSDGEGAVSWKLFGSPDPTFKFPIFERACVQVQK
ncbi:hypothetical protein PC116_g25134 [Phytophthora cactorum]|uniref:Uncharacterized protein n=1 Tax=Phytophthora cactorum TaxID=29920 RepID=A0A8T1F388_9STRA|nr:hypothetical protein PC111_g19865 [Phytophthora cactorum]KAG2964527.1 hypothetical protein PC118_g20272 [Phytophthora cactorum]KAG4226462.1 hypothetical protein PC116_g25134 [Phytophthora cactorum]